jgi:hypothetical protein
MHHIPVRHPPPSTSGYRSHSRKRGYEAEGLSRQSLTLLLALAAPIARRRVGRVAKQAQWARAAGAARQAPGAGAVARAAGQAAEEQEQRGASCRSNGRGVSGRG